jgi:hypothetical protein
VTSGSDRHQFVGIITVVPRSNYLSRNCESGRVATALVSGSGRTRPRRPDPPMDPTIWRNTAMMARRTRALSTRGGGSDGGKTVHWEVLLPCVAGWVDSWLAATDGIPALEGDSEARATAATVQSMALTILQKGLLAQNTGEARDVGT